VNNPGLIAIVGRPNVGKSALFNRIARRRIAIVHDMPGVTRDRVSAEVEWQGRPFTLVDTGGIGLVPGEKSDDVIATSTVDQVNIAIDAADVILLVVDVHEGIVPLDQEVAQHLHRSGKPVQLIANKADNAPDAESVTDFASLGFEEMFPVSALHDRGIIPVMEAALKHLPKTTNRDLRTENPLKLAIVGRPNVGKSSLINALTQSDRVIVSDIPGTTRDAVDVPFTIETDGRQQPGLLIDTAGLRKKRRVKDSLEYFSVTRTRDAIDRCDIAVLVLDATTGILEQDKKIADLITRRNRACILVVNKWDLAEPKVKQTRREHRANTRKGKKGNRPLLTLAEFGQWVQGELFFLDYAPAIFTSATEGFHLDRFLEAIRYVDDQLQQRIPTPLLNRTLADAIDHRQPPSKSGKRLKFYYATQVAQSPPTILLFVNTPELFSAQYQKYLGDQLRKAFGYEGCPLVLKARPRRRENE
tara:strand:+ start:9697 stop:11115 length:1419 start_codon:yes stop_codon:yes gene_type:complete